MTEAEWMACTNLGEMVYFLRNRVTDRKWRLFAAACCRSVLNSLGDPRCRNAIALTERLADGNARLDELVAAQQLACAVLEETGANRKSHPVEDIARVITIPTLDAQTVAHATAMNVVGVIGEMAWKEAMGQGRRRQEKKRREAWRQEESTQISLLPDVVGNPFRPATLAPVWLDWNDGVIRKLAQAVYDDRAFDRLPVLADALEEAGSTDAALLTHCRGPGPHVRGCWLVDLLLDKK